MGHKKAKSKQEQRDKHRWSENQEAKSPPSKKTKDPSSYMQQLSLDCSEQEALVLDHPPKQYCQKKKPPAPLDDDEDDVAICVDNFAKKKKKKACKFKSLLLPTEPNNNGAKNTTNHVASSDDSSSSNGSDVSKGEEDNVNDDENADYYLKDLLEAYLEDEELEAHERQLTQKKVIQANLERCVAQVPVDTNYENYLKKLMQEAEERRRVKTIDATVAQILCLQLDGQLQKYLTVHNRTAAIHNINIIASKLLILAYQREQRNDIYMCQGLHLICQVINHIAMAEFSGQYSR